MDKSAFAKLLLPHIPAQIKQAADDKPSELAASFLAEVAGGKGGAGGYIQELAPSSSFDSFNSGGAFSSSFARGG
jgi:hypothetical protein